ncbi:MAG: hypothetical protein O2963_02495 [Proteobacteria bacterium]|nr:hypothetical protein [Pseudomonadota bacterium]
MGGLASATSFLFTENAYSQESGELNKQQSTISFNQFLNQANPLAKKLIGDTSVGGQDQYLHSLASLASRMDNVPDPASWNDSTQSDKPGTYIGFTPGGESFTILHWRMEPHTRIRLHRHDYGNVVTLGLSGDTRVENYEIVSSNQDYIPGNTIQVRKTVDQQLNAGSINLVSLERNYIHGFTAGPDGARGLDITTRIRPKPAHSTPYLTVGKNALDEFKRIYEAEWEA